MSYAWRRSRRSRSRSQSAAPEPSPRLLRGNEHIMSAAAATTATQPTRIHTISLFVHDRPGALVRVALVFSRRGYNIESLVVSPAASGGFSRMTITSSRPSSGDAAGAIFIPPPK